MNLPPLKRAVKRAAIAQLCSTSNKYTNLQSIAHVAGMAKRQGACMLFLPECFGFLGSSASETLENAEDIHNIHATASNTGSSGNRKDHEQKSGWIQDLERIVDQHQSPESEVEVEAEADGARRMVENVKDSSSHESDAPVSIMRGISAIAQRSGLWISGGGIHESGAPPVENDKLSTSTTTSTSTSISLSNSKSRVYNTHIIINSQGKLITSYRKIHLFDVSIPSQNINLKESNTTAPGSKLIVCDSPLGKLGLSTCYDVRFPEMYTELVERGGAEILLVPSAFTVPTGKAHWHTLLRARAIENQCYVFASAQYGQHNEKRKSYGHAIAIDPWGEVMGDAGGYSSSSSSSSSGAGAGEDTDPIIATPSIILCDVDPDQIRTTRERMPLTTHRQNCPFSW